MQEKEAIGTYTYTYRLEYQRQIQFIHEGYKGFHLQVVHDIGYMHIHTKIGSGISQGI